MTDTLKDPNANPMPKPVALSDAKVREIVARIVRGAEVKAQARTAQDHEARSALFTIKNVFEKRTYPYHPLYRAEQDEKRRAARQQLKDMMEEKAYVWEFLTRQLLAQASTHFHTFQGHHTKVVKDSDSKIPEAWSWYIAEARNGQRAWVNAEHRMALLTPPHLEMTAREFQTACKTALSKGRKEAKARKRTRENQDNHMALTHAPKVRDVREAWLEYQNRIRAALYVQTPHTELELKRDPTLRGDNLPTSPLQTKNGKSLTHRTLRFPVGTFSYEKPIETVFLKGTQSGRGLAKNTADVEIPLNERDAERMGRFLRNRPIDAIREILVTESAITGHLSVTFLVRGAVPGREGIDHAARNPRRVAAMDPGVARTTFLVGEAHEEQGSLSFAPLAFLQIEGASLAKARAAESRGSKAQVALPAVGQHLSTRDKAILERRVEKAANRVHEQTQYALKTAENFFREYEIKALKIPATLMRKSPGQDPTAPSHLSVHAAQWSHEFQRLVAQRAHAMGIQLVYVDESTTSTTCPRCDARFPSPEQGRWTCPAGCDLTFETRDELGAANIQSKVGPLRFSISDDYRWFADCPRFVVDPRLTHIPIPWSL